MATSSMATIEFYQGVRLEPGGLSWLLRARLCHEEFGELKPFRKWLEGQLREIHAEKLVHSPFPDAIDVAGLLLTRTAVGELKEPCFRICQDIARPSTYLFRVFVDPKGKVETASYAIRYDRRFLISGLDVVDELKPLSDS